MKYIGYVPGNVCDPEEFDTIKQLEMWVDEMICEGAELGEIKVFELGKELEFKISIQPKATVTR